MAVDRFASRRNKLISRLKKTEAQALLVTDPVNVTYLTGFTGDSTWLLIGPANLLLFSDSRYEIQIADQCPDLELVLRGRDEQLAATVARALQKARLTRLGFEAATVTYAEYAMLSKATKTVEWLPMGKLVKELRQIKDAGELACIKRAIEQAERGFGVLRATLVPDMTERRAAYDLEHAMRGFGALGTSFDPIVGVGPNAALAHGRPGESKIGDADFVLIDWGATDPSGYCSDLTRVLVTGKISPKLANLYRVVLEAQQAAIESIRPGIECREVDRAARKVIEEAGFGAKFGHALGHGIGLDIHELPRVSAGADESLMPGMVITVEPGIYIRGWGGIRIEDDVVVTKDGCEVLTSVPRSLDESVL